MTWRVEKDGGGHFTVIQDALDAAAAGDTIQIGPGRFEDFRLQTPAYYATRPLILFVHSGPLTILGSGPWSTFIGPESPVFELDGRPTRGLLQERPGTRLRLDGLTIENVSRAISLAEGAEIHNCHFRNAYDILMLLEPEPIEDLLIENCVFEGVQWQDGLWGIASIVGSSQPRMRVRNTTFRRLWSSFNTEYCHDCEFEDVRFEDGRDGLNVKYASFASLRGLVFLNMWRVGVHA